MYSGGYSISGLEMLLDGDVDFHSTNPVEAFLIVPLLIARAHGCLYSGGWKMETLLRGDVNFCSTNEVDLFNIAGSVSDALVV
jgi:hypothetical protein